MAMLRFKGFMRNPDGGLEVYEATPSKDELEARAMLRRIGEERASLQRKDWEFRRVEEGYRIGREGSPA